MTREPTLRLGEIGAVLAERSPDILDATLALLESVPPALDAARSERYEIQHHIGEGGQAEVLLGVLRGADGFQRPVAVKRLRAKFAKQARFASLLFEEAHRASWFSHPNVVSVVDFNRDAEGRPYLVMEYVDGVNLGVLIDAGPVPQPVAIFITRELLAGLGHLHERRDRGRGRALGLVHRDVTPRNVLLSWVGQVKLADFGLAQVLDGPMTAGEGLAVGTPGYMSPEQASGEALDGRSDLYAVGIVLWELLARRRLRGGSPRESIAAAVAGTIRRPSKYQQIPADLEVVTMRLLARRREGRFGTAESAARELMRCECAPRDGRGDLVHLLDERFPRTCRQGPLSRPLAPGASSKSWSTMTATPPRLVEQAEQRLRRARRRRRT